VGCATDADADADGDGDDGDGDGDGDGDVVIGRPVAGSRGMLGPWNGHRKRSRRVHRPPPRNGAPHS